MNRLTRAAMVLLFVIPAAATATIQRSHENKKDSDGDGLSDFQETFKYLSDPNASDSDGDGVPDGDWIERREHQYIIRSVVQVMRPVTPEYLNDDFQDVRVLDETEDYVELEIIHYPFSRAPKAITSNPKWRRTARPLKPWIEPGPSSDWTPALRRQLERDLEADGIDIDKLDDRQVIESVSKWLCDRAPQTSGCTSFITAWDKKGRRTIPEMFRKNLEGNLRERHRTLEEQWEREVSASGMYLQRTRGTCTSSAIYLSGCLRALGIPTRTILCIPLIDAGDPREFELLDNIDNAVVRRHLRGALERIKNTWASHTFNEVYVGDRWHRLNYQRLGQGTYDRQFFGLLSHIATFRDWADAEFHKTVGRRQKADDRPRDVFGYNNPYSTISLRDEKGVHCTQVPELEGSRFTVQQIFWTDDEALRRDIRENCARRPLGLIARVDGFQDPREFADFVNQCNRRAFLSTPESSGRAAELPLEFHAGCYWVSDTEAHIYLPLLNDSHQHLIRNATYRFSTADRSLDKGWDLAEDLSIVRTKSTVK